MDLQQHSASLDKARLSQVQRRKQNDPPKRVDQLKGRAFALSPHLPNRREAEVIETDEARAEGIGCQRTEAH